jgi:uncharacterized protein
MCARCKSPFFETPKLKLPSYGSGMGIEQVIGSRRTDVLRLAQKFGATEVRVFGSVARKEATLASDVDILVDVAGPEYDPISLTLGLEQLLEREVDLLSEGALHWFIQPQVIAEAVPL